MTLATGGTVTDGTDGYRRHTFNTSADLVVSVAGDVDYLLVGAGAGGGNSTNTAFGSGGGGAGAVKTGVAMALSVTTYPVVIGAGGAGTNNGTNAVGGSGNQSTFNGITAGGGGGSGYQTTVGANGVNGGSGGGGGWNNAATTPAGGTSDTGFSGGSGFGSATANLRAGGGGGGAGAVGQAAASADAGNGGIGVQSSISGSATYYGGGGGGGAATLSNVGLGGLGGGSAGRDVTGARPNATDNTGGGGGGIEGTHQDGGGNGGSGLAIVRYLGTVSITDAGDELFLNGDSVTVTGTYFIATQGTGRVVISPTDNIADAGAVAQTVTGWGNTSATITVVKGSLLTGATHYLFVENDLDAANASGFPVAFLASPVTVTDAGDETYDSGDAVTVTGSNFISIQGSGKVYISPADDVNDAGRVQQTVNSWSDTSAGITAVQGMLAPVVAHYLFVVNSQGISNASGWPVVFEAEPIPPAAGGGVDFIQPIGFIEFIQ